jgi:hypothetical protein
VLKVYKELQVLKEFKEYKDPPELKALLAHKALLVLKECRASPVQWLDQPIKWSTKTAPT